MLGFFNRVFAVIGVMGVKLDGFMLLNRMAPHEIATGCPSTGRVWYLQRVACSLFLVWCGRCQGRATAWQMKWVSRTGGRLGCSKVAVSLRSQNYLFLVFREYMTSGLRHYRITRKVLIAHLWTNFQATLLDNEDSANAQPCVYANISPRLFAKPSCSFCVPHLFRKKSGRIIHLRRCVISGVGVAPPTVTTMVVVCLVIYMFIIRSIFGIWNQKSGIWNFYSRLGANSFVEGLRGRVLCCGAFLNVKIAWKFKLCICLFRPPPGGGDNRNSIFQIPDSRFRKYYYEHGFLTPAWSVLIGRRQCFAAASFGAV